MTFSCSVNLATMVCGLPYAVAAAVAYPKRQIIAMHCHISPKLQDMLVDK